MPPKKGTKKAPAKAAAKKTTAAEKKAAVAAASATNEAAANGNQETELVAQQQQIDVAENKQAVTESKADVGKSSAVQAESSTSRVVSQVNQNNPEDAKKTTEGTNASVETNKVSPNGVVDQTTLNGVTESHVVTNDGQQPNAEMPNQSNALDAKDQAAIDQAAAENGRVVEIANNNTNEVNAQNIENRTIFLGSNTTAVQQSEPSAQAKTVSELTEQEKKALRKQRFGNGAPAEGSTLDQAEKIKAAKEKIAQRAERFGIQTKEKFQEKIKGRQQRFGIETKESQQQKKKQRMERFGMMVNHADEIIGDSTEFEKKKKARMERFGNVEEQDKNQKSLLKKRRFNNRSNGKKSKKYH